MGADIHAHVEIKMHNQWYHYSDLSVNRNYLVFGKLAGVRNDDIDHFEVKGLPEDITFITKVHYDMNNEYWHTASYLTKKEMQEFSNWLKVNEINYDISEWASSYLFDNLILDDHNGLVEDVRIIFWFDN